MAEFPFISIIICTYNRAGYLQETLASLLQTKTGPGQFEVLVIDNNSTDETQNVAQRAKQQHPNFKLSYIKESRQGLSHARNRGIREASAPVILFLDDDITLQPDYLPAWITFFKNHPKASGGGGKIHVQFDDPRPPWMSHFLLPLLGHHDLGESIKKYPSGKYPFGGNMAFRKEIFETYGTFNPDLGRKGSTLMASEEKEFYHRLAGREDIYYLPDAFLYHRVNKKRLTKDYIKKQALGLGKSISLRVEKASVTTKVWHLASEVGKICATIILFICYSIALKYPKAKMLVKFRRWIWQGYRSNIS